MQKPLSVTQAMCHHRPPPVPPPQSIGITRQCGRFVGHQGKAAGSTRKHSFVTHLVSPVSLGVLGSSTPLCLCKLYVTCHNRWRRGSHSQTYQERREQAKRPFRAPDSESGRVPGDPSHPTSGWAAEAQLQPACCPRQTT